MSNAAKAKRQFMATYAHEGSDWSLTFYAVDERDAERKVTSIKRTLSLDGEMAGMVRVPFFNINFGMLREWFRR